MSWCRNGGRDAYERPAVKEYDQEKPIRGRIVYGDGSYSRITFARMVNGKERKVAYVEVDGDIFLRPSPATAEPKVKTCPRCGRDEWFAPGLFEPKTCRCGARYEEE